MANNIEIKDAAAATKTVKTTETAGVHTPHHNVDTIAAGDNNIGNVDIVTLPALPAGTNNIGDVDVVTLPALPAGTNNIGDVDLASAIPAGSAIIGKVGIDQTTPGTTDSVTLKATEAHLGEVGGKVIPLTATPTVSTSPAYAAGDALGGKITLTNAVRVSGSSGSINTVVITDLGKQNAPIDVVFFNADPSNTTFTDNAALDISDVDILTIVGVISVTTWINFNDNSVGVALGCGLDFVLAGTSLFACLVNRGTPTYTATTDIQLRVAVSAN